MKRLILTSTILTATAPAMAQQTYDLGTIVLSSSLSPVELGRTGATVEVLEGEETGANDTAVIDRLDRLPGVSSSSDGGIGSTASLRIRGLPSRYIGVRINGIDVADPSSVQNQFNFGGLTASGIDRIELLKGSQSALYGSEAIGGVVNITTFTPEKLGFSGQVDVEAGSFDTYSGTLSAGYKSEKGVVALSYGRLNTDGISARVGEPENDGYEQTVVNMTGQYDITDDFTVGGALYYRDRDVSYDISVTDPAGTTLVEERGARTFATLRTGAVTHTLSYSRFDINRDFLTFEYDGGRDTYSYLGSAELGVAYTLNFGLDYTEEDFSNTFGDSAEETNKSANLELLVSPSNNIDLSAALRYDDNSSFGGKTTGRFAAVWRPVEELAFRAVVGTGFRTPSLTQRFGVNGDAALKPEESVSYEVGVEKSLPAGFIKATVFYTEIDDVIDFDPAAGGCPSPWGCYVQVPGTSISKGIELSGEYALTSKLNLFGNYTYTNARKEDGAPRPRTPKHDFVLGLSNDFTDRFAAYVDVRHVADVVPSANAPTVNKVGDYTLVGAGASYDVTDAVELYLRVENLFDEDYETVGGYNQPGRAAYVGLRASF